MKSYIFFSVHEKLFHEVAAGLRASGVDTHSGFVWGEQQARTILDRGVTYEPLIVFTRDLLPLCDDGQQPDVEWLERRERELGVSIQRMLAAERHLLKGRTYEQILRLAEVILREVAAAYDRIKPDFVFSEDISCFTSYAHFILARERKIPFWCIGTARLPKRLSIYSAGFQRSERVESLYNEIRARGLTNDERVEATKYVDEFRNHPAPPPGMNVRAVRPGMGLEDLRYLTQAVSRYLGDRDDPTSTAPLQVIRQRVRRIARIQIAEITKLFERPVAGEKYVLYPIHFQPEASTLVQAPMYLDQISLLREIAQSLPVGYRLYVKEHKTNRGRLPLSFYEAIKAIPSVRLLGPDEDTWSLIRDARLITVITGTMGWEGMLFDKPVVIFGAVWFDILPHVYRANDVPKDGWYGMFSKALTAHKPDSEAVLALVSAMFQTSYPGRMHNPRSHPEAMEPSNIADITRALAASAVGPAHG